MNRNRVLLLAFTTLTLLPIAATAAVVASSAIPDGTYTGKVVRVIDPKHVDVLLDNGDESTLPSGRSYVDFSKLQANDQIKVSIISGSVMVFLDLTSH